MTKPIPQREPMLALPEPKAIYIPKLNILFTNITVKVGKWAKSIDYKKQVF